ncbi:hypothetical protein H8E52_09865 [bacterium]|nr:hypothetical protein [bacterium]
MKTERRIPLLAMGLLLALAPMASADCSISGISTAEPNPDDPAWGDWKYTIEMSWDNLEMAHGLSHWNVLFGAEAQICCDPAYYAFGDSSGVSTGEPDACEVSYMAELNCAGDPSIPGEEGALIKFEPIWGDCEPASTGSGIFFFYSDFAPLPLTEPNELLIFKAAGDACYGSLSGVLPLDCEPTAAEPSNWSTIKSQF